MRVAILQPAYLSWLGYFDLLDQVDHFVLLDSVQFEKRSWQQRNRIKTPIGLHWLTVPVVSRGKREQRIAEVEIQGEFWRDHIRSVEMNYRRSAFFDRYFGKLSGWMEEGAASARLATLTIGLLRRLAEELEIRTPMTRSSEMAVEGKRTNLLAEICVALGATTYLSPLGSADYLLNELPMMTDRGIAVEFQHYEHPEYSQLFPPFQPFASVIDLLFNEGDKAREIIRSGRRAAFLPHEVAHQANARVES